MQRNSNKIFHSCHPIINFNSLYHQGDVSQGGCFLGGAVVESPPAHAGNARDVGSIPRWGRSPGGGNGNPLQNSCLDYFMDRGAWWATVHGFTKSWTQLSIHTRCIHTDFRYYQLFLTPLGMLHKIGCLDTQTSAELE